MPEHRRGHNHHVPYGPKVEKVSGGVPCAEWNHFIYLIGRIARNNEITDADMMSWFAAGVEDRKNYESSGVYYDGRE